MATSSGSVIFCRGQTGNMSQEEIWDDTALIKAYDQAVGLVKEEVQRRIADLSCGESDPSTKGEKKKKKKRKKNRLKRHSWQEGDMCRCEFSEDGLVYEAKIMEIRRNGVTCTVQYIGYDNEEDVPLKMLEFSHGRSARRRQILDALEEETFEDSSNKSDQEETEDQPNKSRRLSGNYRQSSYSSHTHHDRSQLKSHQTTQDDVGVEQQQQSATSIPFMPPFPPSSSSPDVGKMFSSMSWMNSVTPPTFPFTLPPPPPVSQEAQDGDSEALSSMLMSWYMSGYHTGYYHGLKHSQVRKPSTRYDSHATTATVGIGKPMEESHT